MPTLKRGPIPGLPDSSLAECLFITAKRKAGKSYLQRLAMERALTKGIRTGWIDAMGIGWGITVQGDPNNLEKPIGPGYDVVVFGGDHGHLPLNPLAGAALGTMLAKATFSWVLDISKFKSKAERVRFMAAFTEALYENCASQLLLFVDEIDLWAPQQIMDKQGPITTLLGTMDEIVRRGRIKGLVVWMATQRPAVVNLSIRSQAECFIAMKTTAPQDIEAVMSWLKFHLKKENFQEQAARFPALHRGQGIVYMTEPEISIREQQFPLIHTLDTMTPRQAGERPQSDKFAAKPDIAAITAELGTITETLKADDPAFLKSEIARLTKELEAKPKLVAAPKVDVVKLKTAHFDKGLAAGNKMAERQLKTLQAYVTKQVAEMTRKLSQILAGMARNAEAVEKGLAALREAAAQITSATDLKFPELEAELEKMAKVVLAGDPVPVPAPPAPAAPRPPINSLPRAPRAPEPYTGNGELTGTQRKILNAVAWWADARQDRPTRAQVAVIANLAAGSGNFTNRIGELCKMEYLTIPVAGRLQLTEKGMGQVPACAGLRTTAELHAKVNDALTGTQRAILAAAIAAYPNGITREQLAQDSNLAAGSGNFTNRVGELKTMDIFTIPEKGVVRVADWLFL